MHSSSRMTRTSGAIDGSPGDAAVLARSVGEPDDAAMVARSLRDSSQFAAIYDSYFVEVYRYLAGRLGRDIAEDLAAAAEGDTVLGRAQRRHVERCLRCQAEVVQYRRLLRAMRSLRTDVLEPAPGLLADILATLEEAGERQAVRSLLSGRRMAYLGGLAAATAAGAAGAIVFATRTRRARLAG